MRQSYLRLILIIVLVAAGITGIVGFAPISITGVASQVVVPDSAQLVRRVATTSRLAAEEYRLGVKGGRVVLAPEVEEAKLFLAEAQAAAGKLPPKQAGPVMTELTALIAMVSRVGPPDSIANRVELLVTALARELAVVLDELPASAPTLAQGRTVYQAQCASCHGVTGGGDGPLSFGMTPAPAKLADAGFFQGASPLDFYRRITIGVAGTAMPAFEATLSLDDRWAAALYASTLRLPRPRGSVPVGLADFRVTAGLSDQALLDSLGVPDLARVAAARAAGETGRRDYRPVFLAVRSWLDSSFRLARAGRSGESRSAALNAYMAFEQVERGLRVKDDGLVLRAEAAFARARELSDPAAISSVEAELSNTLDRAERLVGVTLTPATLFLQSFLILIREGLEAILVIGALIAFLTKMGVRDRARDIHWGVAAALVLSLLTAVAIETVFRLGPAHQELLEGATMAVAAVMLFGVSYWLLSKMEVARWNRFVAGRLTEAVSRRSMLALASVGFLAVYREGFETVLFYKALAVSGGGSGTAGPIAAGFGVAAVALGLVYLAINRFGVRIPLRPFFAVTGAFLYLMAFIFAGSAVAELQEGGLVSITPLPGWPRVPALGIFPTVESAAVQAILALLAVGGLVWSFGIAPRRRARPVDGSRAEPAPASPRSSRPNAAR
jgi:high-affinity iron transporter